MRNRNDAGNVHFDESTREMIQERNLSILHKGKPFTITLKIPKTILETLEDEDFHNAELLMERRIDRILLGLMQHGIFSVERLNFMASQRLILETCEMLYDQFTRHQARLGNQVWATPKTMQHIGPAPEEDGKYLVAPGRLG